MKIKVNICNIDGKVHVDRNVVVSGLFNAHDITSDIENIQRQLMYPKFKPYLNDLDNRPTSLNVIYNNGVIKNIISKKRFDENDFSAILKSVSKVYNISSESILNNLKKRSSTYLYPRRAIIVVYRTNSRLRLERIGSLLDKDHATVIHAVKSATQDIKYNYLQEKDVYTELEHELGIEIINKLK